MPEDSDEEQDEITTETPAQTEISPQSPEEEKKEVKHISPEKIKSAGNMAKEFPCGVCGKVFNLKILWYHHLRKEHFEDFVKLFPHNSVKAGRKKKGEVAITAVNFGNVFDKNKEEKIIAEQSEIINKKSEPVEEKLEKIRTITKNKQPIYVRPPKDGDIEESDDYLDSPDAGLIKQKSLLGVRSAKYSGEETHMAELLINNGFAKDFTDLNRKSLRLTFSLMKGDVGGNMGFGLSTKQKTITEMLEELNRRELEEAEIELLKSKITAKTGNKGGKKMDFAEVMMLKMLFDNNNNAPKNNTSEMVQMMELMTKVQNASQPQPQKDSFTQFRELMEMAKLMNPSPQNPNDAFKQNIEMFKTMLDGNKGDQTKEILEFLKDREANMYKSQTEIQKLRDEQYKMILDQKIEQLSKQVQTASTSEGGLDFQKIADQIKVIKELSSQISGEQKPSALDYIDSIGQNFAPVVAKLLEMKTTKQTVAPSGFGAGRFQKVPDQKMNGLSDEQIMNIHRKTNVNNSVNVANANDYMQGVPYTGTDEEDEGEDEGDSQEEESLKPKIDQRYAQLNPDFLPKPKKGKLIPDGGKIELPAVEEIPGYVG